MGAFPAEYAFALRKIEGRQTTYYPDYPSGTSFHAFATTRAGFYDSGGGCAWWARADIRRHRVARKELTSRD
ncbi:hypothetical protein PMI09_03634 [Rhizobium sp. CF122]|nr:hypothetical protein PMI09_03634 [Rhizobium sp. CF122]